MKIIWDYTTDAEFIEGRRMLYERATRNQRWTYFIALISVLSISVAGVFSVTPTFVQYLTGQLATFAPEFTYFMGLGQGLLLATWLLLAVQFLVYQFASLRTWRLLLAYHDRLEQAGFLPGEAVETMEIDPNTPRS